MDHCRQPEGQSFAGLLVGEGVSRSGGLKRSLNCSECRGFSRGYLLIDQEVDSSDEACMLPVSTEDVLGYS